MFESLKTISQHRVCLKFRSESLDRPTLVAALSISPYLIKSFDDPTRIHTLRTYIGQAEAVELATVKATQLE